MTEQGLFQASTARFHWCWIGKCGVMPERIQLRASLWWTERPKQLL